MSYWNLWIFLAIVCAVICIQIWLGNILDALKEIRDNTRSINTKLLYIKDDINTIKNKKE